MQHPGNVSTDSSKWRLVTVAAVHIWCCGSLLGPNVDEAWDYFRMLILRVDDVSVM